MQPRETGVLNERETARLLKRIDRMVPVEEAEKRLLVSSKRVAYARVSIAVLWIIVFGSMWAVGYYSILSEHSESLGYILPRLALSTGMIGAVVYLRLTDRLKLRWALVAAVIILAISRAIV